MTVIVGVVLLFWTAVTFDVLTLFEEALVAVTDAFPSWMDPILSLVYGFGFLYAIFLVFATAIGGRSRFDALRDILLAALVSGTITIFLVQRFSDAWPYVLPELGLENPEPQFPVLRIALVTAMLIAAGPHLARPMRRLGWAIVIVIALAAVGLGYGFPSDAVGGVAVGMISAGAVLLAFGSPKGYPDKETVLMALAQAGVSIGDIRIGDVQSWGVRRLIATADDGTEYDIKAYGRDATDSQLMSKLWRGVWYKAQGPSVTYSRIQGVEHEALVTLMAHRTGASVPDVEAATQPNDQVALLALSRSGPSMVQLGADDVTGDQLEAIWRDVASIHTAGLSHGALTTDSVRINEAGHEISDFTFGSLTATESQQSLDIVEFLFSTTLLVGPERAVAAAHRGLGSEALGTALPFLQIPAVSSQTRKQADKPKNVMKAIREEVATVTGEELPAPARLRRVSGRNLLMAGLLFFAAYAFIPMILGIDFAAVWDVLENANWFLIIVALGIGHLVFIPEATGMMFAAGMSLPLWPLTSLQVSVKFIGLAVPSAAGRITMNAAFLYKYGISAAQSITQGAIDGISGFLVEAMILLTALVFGDISLGLDVDVDEVNWGLILLIIVLVVAGVVIAVFRIRKLRDLIIPILKEAWGSLAGVLKRPSRALGLLGSNLVARLILATTLFLILWAVDSPLSFGSCLVAVVATNLLAGLVPIPGGIGVAETFMTGILVVMGLDEATAFAATITYRMISFYLPAVEGFPAMKWLESNGYL